MAIVLGQEGDADAALSQINTTPLVDVMLVLLIIFLITIPVVTTSIKVELPKERVELRETRPENVIVSVNQAGSIFWYDAPVGDTRALIDKLKKVSLQKPQPEVQIRGDMNGSYAGVGTLMYACQVAGIAKVSFITEPGALGAGS